MKRKYLLIISLVLCIMVIIIGSTYAYFNVINTGESSDVIINAKTLAIRYIDGPSITESGILPGTKIVKTFAVTNEGDDDVYYSIKLIDVINELVASSDLVYDLEGDNGVNYSSQLYPSYDKTITDFILIGALET